MPRVGIVLPSILTPLVTIQNSEAVPSSTGAWDSTLRKTSTAITMLAASTIKSFERCRKCRFLAKVQTCVREIAEYYCWPARHSVQNRGALHDEKLSGRPPSKP